MVARTVILEKKAAAAIDVAVRIYPDLDKIYRALEYRIARNPHAGHCIPRSNPPTHIIRSKEWRGTPSLVLLYRFTNDEVTVLSARVRPLEARAETTDDSELAS